MPESATILNAVSNNAVTVLGSFEAGPRVFDRRSTSEPVATIEVMGLSGTRFAGTKGFASCIVLPSNQPGRVQEAQVVLERIRSLAGPALVPVLETGIAGRVAFVTEAAVDGERLSSRLDRQGRFTPPLVAVVIDDIAAAFDAAHQIGLHHGAISPFSIWIDDRDHCQVGGFGLAGRGLELDLEQLSRLAIELLAALPIDVPSNEPLSSDRVRGHINGLTERAASAIARGFLALSAGGYQSASGFASSFRAAVESSALDLVAGAWEAISRADIQMAKLLVEMVAGYDPGAQELPLLRLKLNNNGFGDPASAAARLVSAATVRLPDHLGAHITCGDDPNAATYHSGAKSELSPEIRTMLAGPIAETKLRSGMNYWALFAAGVFAMIIIMVVLVALTFTST